MKKIVFQIGMLCSISSIAWAQNPPVTQDLKLYLEVLNNAASFTPGSVPQYTLGTTPAYWSDQSNSGTDVQTFFDPNTPLNNPQYVFNAHNTGFDAVRFDQSVMENVIIPFDPAFDAAEATLFVVRIAETEVQQVLPGSNGVMNRPYQSMVSIAEPTALGFQDYNNEFGIGGDVGLHHTTSGTYNYRNQQCFGVVGSQLPDDRPVALCARLGQQAMDIDYWVNGVLSTNVIQQTVNVAQPYTVADRRWVVGGRFKSGALLRDESFNGDILEVLAYERRLTDAEVDAVNDYLKCKYNINYSNAQCNDPINCDCSYELNGSMVIALNAALNVQYTGPDANGNCQFTATASATLAPGWIVDGYEWTIPGVGHISTSTSALTDTQVFSLLNNSTDDVTVRVLAHNNNYGDMDPHWCCNHEVTVNVWCQGSQGGTN